MNIFHLLVFQPVYNLVVFFADIFPGANFGLAILSATLLLKLLFLSLSKKQIESQRQMQEIQPKLKQIQERFKDDKERQSREIMSLYKENGVNPFMGCLPMVIQIIFLIAIYRVILSISDTGFAPNPGELYGFVPNPGLLYKTFLFTDLSVPSIIFAVIAAAGQFYQTRMLMATKKDGNDGKNGRKSGQKCEKSAGEQSKDPDFASMMNQQMLYLGPAMTLFIGLRFPAALSLYWLVSTAFAIVQQRFLLREKAVGTGTANIRGKKSVQ